MVLPTYNRLPALQDTLPFLLEVRGVDEIVVVDDASVDGSAEWLEGLGDPRVRVVRHPERRGQPAVRNRGFAEARHDWVVFAEDDCRFPPDYVEILLEEAGVLDADVVGAPWIFTDGRSLEEARAAHVARATDDIVFDQVMRFPSRTLVTPFLPALVLVHRRVFDRLRYDERYGGNAFREESDYYIAAARAGFRCVLTPRTQSWQTQRWPGGAHMARWRYELWSVRNTGRFLRKHGAWLHERGLLDRPAGVLLRFAARRARHLVDWYGRPVAGRALRRAGLKS
jgi:glycosyltransferase involved in cell wall biosynthesis